MAQPAPSPLQLDSKYDDYDFPTSAPTPQNGHPGYLTPEQQAQVHQLRLLLEQEGFTKRLDTLTLVWGCASEAWHGPLTDGVVALPARSQVRCGAVQEDVRHTHDWGTAPAPEYSSGYRFIDCEKWRQETKLDDTVPSWEYPEKEEMFKYYPQYYHKTDKVRFCSQDTDNACVSPPFPLMHLS
jgi:hypothetical protein